MHNPIPDPIADRSIIAWAVPVTRALNALTDKVGASARNERDRRGSTTADLGCYRIVTVDRDGTSVHGFGNPYIMVGGVLARHPVDTIVEDLLSASGSDVEGDSFELFLALRILAAPPAVDDPATDADETADNADRVVAYADFAALAAAQRDATHHTIPLYLLDVAKTTDASGNVRYSYEIVCDFRRGVWAQQWEVFA